MQRRPTAQPAPAQTGRPPLQRRFRGQQPGENVISIERPHWIFLVLESLPSVVLGALFITFLVWGFIAPTFGVAIVLRSVFAFFFVLLLVRWAVVDLVDWLTRVYIITDWRLIDSRGLFTKHREQVALDRIQELRVIRPNLLYTIFDLGNVSAKSAGQAHGVQFVGVQRPREITRTISVTQIVGRGGAPLPVEVRNPAARAAWEKLEALDETPPGSLAKPENRVTDGAGIEIPVALFQGEQVLELISRHWLYLLRKELGPLALGLLAIGVAVTSLVTRSLALGGLPLVLTLVALVVALLWGVAVYGNYSDDVLVLTTHRIIDIDRLFYVFNQSTKDTRYSKIQDVRVEKTFWGTIFGYGNLIIETAAQSAPLSMTFVPHPLHVQDRIYAYMVAAEERTEAFLRGRRRKKEFSRWMGTVLNELLVEVPDVRGASVLEAAERLRASGLRMIVDAERPTQGLRPGVVLEQAPHAGSSALRGNEVRVLISGAAVAQVP